MSYDKVFHFKKSANETITYTVQFLMADTDETYTISSVDTIIIDASGSNVTSSLLDSDTFDSDKAQFTVHSGLNGQIYKINVTATMTNGDILVASGILKVDEF